MLNPKPSDIPIRCPYSTCQDYGTKEICHHYAHTTCEGFREYWEELKKHDKLLFKMLEEENKPKNGASITLPENWSDYKPLS
jgi:hypothetical protein